MNLAVRCPHCGQHHRVGPEMAGQVGQCVRCRRLMRVPARPERPEGSRAEPAGLAVDLVAGRVGGSVEIDPPPDTVIRRKGELGALLDEQRFDEAHQLLNDSLPVEIPPPEYRDAHVDQAESPPVPESPASVAVDFLEPDSFARDAAADKLLDTDTAARVRADVRRKIEHLEHLLERGEWRTIGPILHTLRVPEGENELARRRADLAGRVAAYASRAERPRQAVMVEPSPDPTPELSQPMLAPMAERVRGSVGLRHPAAIVGIALVSALVVGLCVWFVMREPPEPRIAIQANVPSDSTLTHEQLGRAALTLVSQWYAHPESLSFAGMRVLEAREGAYLVALGVEGVPRGPGGNALESSLPGMSGPGLAFYLVVIHEHEGVLIEGDFTTDTRRYGGDVYFEPGQFAMPDPMVVEAVKLASGWPR